MHIDASGRGLRVPGQDGPRMTQSRPQGWSDTAAESDSSDAGTGPFVLARRPTCSGGPVCARGRDRTCTALTGQRILSPPRMPISPPGPGASYLSRDSGLQKKGLERHPRELRLIQLTVRAAGTHELGMRSPLYDLASIDDEDLVGLDDRR